MVPGKRQELGCSLCSSCEGLVAWVSLWLLSCFGAGEAECLGPDCCVKSFRDVALGFGLGGASEVGSGIRWNLILLFCAYGKPQELSLMTTEVLCSLCFLEITAN